MDLKRLAETLGRPELSRILDRLHRRLCKKPVISGNLILSDPTQAERQGLNRIFGKQFLGQTIRIPLAAFDEMLFHSGICPGGLLEAVAQMRGPLVDPRLIRESRKRRWEELFAQAAERDPREAVCQWLAQVRQSGLLLMLSRDFAHGRQLLHQALDAAAHLPAKDMQLKELAARVTGSAHGLDQETALNTLLFGLARNLGGQVDSATPLHKRLQWERVGLIGDELSSTVLVLGLRAQQTSGTGKLLSLCADSGEPCWLTLRQLRRHPPHLLGHRVYVCENPAVVQAAAMQLKPGHHPLICIAGRPHDAAQFLLHQLVAQGFEIYYHGDFDGPGLEIARSMMCQFDAKPWRMAASDYLAAPSGHPLKDDPTASPWDPELGEAMKGRGVAVHEELVLADLLSDLNAKRSSSDSPEN